MVKVKMLARHTGPAGKMEQGLEYLLPPNLAHELVRSGIAILVVSPKVVKEVAPPVIATPPVQFSKPKSRFSPQGTTDRKKKI